MTHAGDEPPRVAAVSSDAPIDVRVPLGDGEVPLHASDDVAATLAGLGRTEDLAISPDGSLIVIAGFTSNQLTLVRITACDDGVHVVDVHPCDAAGVERPHGLAFLDHTNLLVANRESALSLVVLDDAGTSVVSSTVLVDESADVPVRTPGSVAARSLGGDLVEVLVCNNYVHDVTRYVVDGRRGWSVVDAETLVSAGLEIPDGIAISDSGDWIAISNHNQHAVYVYRYDDHLAPDTEPAGVLRGINYPHGVAFADGDRQLVVVDAGLPNLYSFSAPDADWSGERIPWRIDRIMDDRAFHRGRYNPQEGGPKGLEIVAGRFAAVTSEFQPLAFFGLHDRAAGADSALEESAATSRQVRTPLLRLADRNRAAALDLRQRTTELDASRSELERMRAELEVTCAALVASRSEGNELRQARSIAEQRAAGEIAIVRDELGRSRREHAHAGIEIDRLLARIDELDAHIGAMYASRSWRWSSPLRTPTWLRQRLRAVGRGSGR